MHCNAQLCRQALQNSVDATVDGTNIVQEGLESVLLTQWLIDEEVKVCSRFLTAPETRD